MCKITSDLMLSSGANLQRDLAQTSCKPLQMLEEGQRCPAPRQVQGLTGPLLVNLSLHNLKLNSSTRSAHHLRNLLNFYSTL